MRPIRQFLAAAAAPAFAVALLGTLPGVAAAQDMDFELINTSGYTLMEFYASPTDVGSWEEDILGANVLPSGSSGLVTIADGRSQCAYDIRMVFDDGTDLVDAVNICELGSYTIE